MEKLSLEQLKAKAKLIRRHIIEMTGTAGSGHPGGSLSATDIVTALYFNLMDHNPQDPQWPDVVPSLKSLEGSMWYEG